MTRPRLAAVCCALALLPAAGCGGEGDPAPETGVAQGSAEAPITTDAAAEEVAVDPCLVDDEEMAGILAEQLPSDEGDVTVTSENSSLGADTCVYSWSRSTWGADAGKEFTISVLPDDDLTFTAAIGERVPIEGVGDEAFEASGNYFARVGDLVVHLVNLQETDEASVAVLTAAAGNV